jgi:hypothetical protein
MKIPSWIRPPSRSAPPSLEYILDDSKAYFISQTLTPLKGVAKTLLFGFTGSIFAGLGFVLCLVGILRILQSETGSAFSGTWTFVPYLAVALCGLFIAAVSIWMGLRRYRKRAVI